MEIGFSGKAFGNLILLLGIIMVIVIFTINAIAKGRGVDTSSNRFQFKLGIYCVIAFLIIPMFFSDLPLKVKIIVAVAGLAGGIANFFVVVLGRKYLKGRSIDKEKW